MGNEEMDFIKNTVAKKKKKKRKEEEARNTKNRPKTILNRFK
jgi:hypothetical protein